MEYATLGGTPIAGDNPAGADCRYEASFEALQAEIDKLSSPTAEGKTDWDKVIQWAAQILANQSKDLTVASYLAVALVRQRKVDGLDEATQIFKDLVENFWDKLYPPKKRMRGRAGAFTWWIEKTEEVLETLELKATPAEQVQRIQDNVKTLETMLDDQMPEPPLLRPLMRYVERIPVQPAAAPPQAPPQPEAQSEPAPAAPQPVSQPQAKGPAPVAQPPAPAVAAPLQAPATEKDALKNIDAAIHDIREASHFLLQQNSKNPAAYRYRRMAAWARIEGLPPNNGGVTQIPPPPFQVLDAMKEHREAANWPALILTAEESVSQFVFWLDLQFAVAEALKNLGREYQAALNAVCRETAYFLKCFPGVENLSFSDEMPFCDEQTRSWLATIGFGGADGESHGSAAISEKQEHVNTLTQDALAMARKKRVAEAIELLCREMDKARSRSERIRWRSAIAQVLLASKKGPSALPHLEQILSEIECFKLEQWDPDLALEGLTLAWKGFSAEGIKEHQGQADDLLARIARINPVAALRLAP